MRACLLALAMVAVLPSPGRADGTVVVLLPLDDLAGRPRIARELSGLLAQQLARRGYEVVHGVAVEQVLERLRVRYLDSLPAPVAGRIREEFGAHGLVLGSLLSYREGNDPAMALSARMVTPEGRQAWTGMVGLTADDTTGMLGRGRVKTADELVGRAVARLFDGFPDPSRRPVARALPMRRTPSPGPITYRAPGFDPRRAQRVCVLPFESFEKRSGAARIAVELASARLRERGGLSVVEAGDLRAAVLSEEVRSLLHPDSGQLRKLARRLDAPLFLRGTVYVYRERDGGGEPEVDMQLTLVNVEEGKIVWTSRLARRGSQYMKLLQRGAISTAAALADQALAEMVDALFEDLERDGG